MSTTKKIVRAYYTQEEEFCIPSNIDLDDKKQVEEWWIKYNTLYIRLVNDKLLRIEGNGITECTSYKYPDSSEILGADEGYCNYDEEDYIEKFKNVDLDDKEDEKNES
jgi:hypothetical protein